jgi:hypothetical protein
MVPQAGGHFAVHCGRQEGDAPYHRCEEDTDDKHQHDFVSTNLQTFLIGGRGMRWRRCNDARYGNNPACSGRQNLAKSSQLPSLAKGRCDVRQLQALRKPELVPDR